MVVLIPTESSPVRTSPDLRHGPERRTASRKAPAVGTLSSARRILLLGHRYASAARNSSNRRRPDLIPHDISFMGPCVRQLGEVSARRRPLLVEAEALADDYQSGMERAAKHDEPFPATIDFSSLIAYIPL